MIRVDELLRGLDPEPRPLSEALRKVIKKALPTAVEQVVWGNPIYVINGKNVVNIMHYSDHVNLGFMGAKLKPKRLEGTEKSLGHVKVRSKVDIDEAEFSRLLKKAASLAK